MWKACFPTRNKILYQIEKKEKKDENGKDTSTNEDACKEMAGIKRMFLYHSKSVYCIILNSRNQFPGKYHGYLSFRTLNLYFSATSKYGFWRHSQESAWGEWLTL